MIKNNEGNNPGLDITYGYISVYNIKFSLCPVFRLMKVKANSKEAIEPNWQDRRNYLFDSPEILRWLKGGGNYGLTAPSGMACLVDADTQDIQCKIDAELPETFRYSTGKEGHFQYAYLIADEPIGCIPLKDGAYIKGKGGYALGPGSTHPNGTIYGTREVRNVPVAIVKKSELLEVLKPFFRKERQRPQVERHKDPNIGELKLNDIINLSGFRFTGQYYQGPHPVHGSNTGSNLEVNTDTNLWYCLRHGTGGSVLEWIAVSEGIIDCSESKPGAIRGMTFWAVIAAAHNHYGLKYSKAAEILRREKNER